MNSKTNSFPPQRIKSSQKTERWGKRCIDWADAKANCSISYVRKDLYHKRINYDLINGKIHMSDVRLLLNPFNLDDSLIPETIQHYPIINSNLRILQGEESARVFDYKVIVTNPTAISEMEEEKNAQVMQRLQQLVQDQSSSDDEFQQRMQEFSDYFQYSYQDIRELRGNYVLNHYSRELCFGELFNDGFVDAMTVAEEGYCFDIEHGEPVVWKVDPMKMRCITSSNSNRLEDCDCIVYEDYWSVGKIYDTFYDVLTESDLKKLENLPNRLAADSDSMGNIRDELEFVPRTEQGIIDETYEHEFSTHGTYFDPINLFHTHAGFHILPCDNDGNIRVLNMRWKSRRCIKRIKYYDEDGEEQYMFMPEEYKPDKVNGEEEELFWINEAWEGTKIGTDIYVNVRPRPIQYNRISNPSKCHLGYVGSIYNVNGQKPFSLVDMMKAYNYLYNIIHDRLNKLIARNYGMLVDFDMAKIPDKYNPQQWMQIAMTTGLALRNSFEEGKKGAATGKLAGSLNNASTGAINLDNSQIIQQYINLLTFIKSEMKEVVGITPQREGQIQNRETVGGVERATLQSSHITEWLFIKHENVKKRFLETFLDTAKVAFRGETKKFQHIGNDLTQILFELDGDEFCECDYGLAADNSIHTQKFYQNLDMLVQAGIQNTLLDFSTVCFLYSSASAAEKMRKISSTEQRKREEQQQAQQQAQQLEQQKLEAQSKQIEIKYQHEDSLNQRDNETRVLVAEINAQAEAQRFAMMNDDFEKEANRENDKQKLLMEMKKLDHQIQMDKKNSSLQERKLAQDKALKEKQLNIQSRRKQ